DESQTFDREPTGNWGPGAPRVLPQRDRRVTGADYAQGVPATRVPQGQSAQFVPQVPTAQAVSSLAQPDVSSAPPTNHELRRTPMPRPRSGGKTRPPPLAVRTALGYASGSGAQSAVVRLGLTPQ